MPHEHPACEPTHRQSTRKGIQSACNKPRGRTIGTDKAFDECVILKAEAFDPDAVFLDDIVDDEVLPCLSLAVDGLTESRDAKRGKLDLRPEDVAANDEIPPSTELPYTPLDPEQLEVYGWESSFWRKIRGYIGF